MKKKIFIIVSLLVILFVSSLMMFADSKGTWKSPIPIRGKFTWVESQATNPVNVRWDYFVYEGGRLKVITKAPGRYPGKFREKKSFYYFYEVDDCNPEDFKILTGEQFILPKSVWNFYVKCADCEVKVEPLKIIIKDMEK